ncbi:MAG: hypothetical protein IKP45_13225 [Bacteroidales bacterium]|nr:hypothetical protein [Bacteroidales bacterium]
MKKRKVKVLTPNDQRSVVKNPNNELYVLDLKNQIKLRQQEIAKMDVVNPVKLEELKSIQRLLAEVLKDL